MEIERVNEENENGNFVIEVKNNYDWLYITTEFSVSVAISVAMNIHIALGQRARVVSRRSKNTVLFDSI